MKLPSIFKFSYLSRILVYYGYLHEWKVLMERLCTQSCNIWKDNLEAFIKAGENNNAPIVIQHDYAKAKSFISNINDNYRFINSIAGNDELFVKLIHEIMNSLGDDKLIKLSCLGWKWLHIFSIFSLFDSCKWKSKYCEPYSISIISKETSHMINWIHLKNWSAYSLDQIN